MALTTDGGWASLPVEILGSIAERLFLVDYTRFGAVCISWSRAVFPKTRLYLPFAPKMPYLLFPGKDLELSDHCFLFNLSDKLLHHISPLPELRDRWFVGSQFGWLMISDRFSNLSLLNPLTRCHISLPPIFIIDPVYNRDGSLHGYKIESGTKETRDTYPDWCFTTPCSMKLVLSSIPIEGGFEAVAILTTSHELLFLRSGEEKWCELSSEYDFADAIYRNGSFLLLTSEGHLMSLDLRVNADASPRLVTVAWSSEEDTNRYMVDSASSDDGSASPEEEKISRYLVDSRGDLLQVCRESAELTIECHGFKVSRHSRFYVRKWDPEEGYWVPVETLGGHSLFVGTSSSFSLAADEIPGLKINSVYFTDDDWAHLEKVVCDIGVFSLEDGSVESCHPYRPWLNWPRPIWIAPALSWMDRRRSPN